MKKNDNGTLLVDNLVEIALLNGFNVASLFLRRFFFVLIQRRVAVVNFGKVAIKARKLIDQFSTDKLLELLDCS